MIECYCNSLDNVRHVMGDAGCAYHEDALLDEAVQEVAHWGQRERIGYRREPYYDVTVYRVPVTASDTDDAGRERIRAALYDRMRTNLTGWSVGGYSTPRVLPGDMPGTVIVETLYHIGD